MAAANANGAEIRFTTALQVLDGRTGERGRTIVREGVGDTLLVEVAGLSLKQLQGLGESAIEVTLRDILDPANADMEFLADFDSGY
ncbi:hypothetical protein [Nocardiopsis sp. NRRL B-16309]|uniref:hypothetical protein n=1 Tax=Nocardiopsis sp. NRRL B-16309 TaxID=1519494 RepID=UPI0006AEFC5A|nr:hypothetical protein [Nocardiopsis sp. NRRL B-16309]KOX19660.1 hypothetical protein ADL05_05930 [Nocardiopsis sp. NRRL B-16309]